MTDLENIQHPLDSEGHNSENTEHENSLNVNDRSSKEEFIEEAEDLTPEEEMLPVDQLEESETMNETPVNPNVIEKPVSEPIEESASIIQNETMDISFEAPIDETSEEHSIDIEEIGNPEIPKSENRGKNEIADFEVETNLGHSDDHDDSEEFEETPDVDLSSLNKGQLLTMAAEAIHLSPKESVKKLQNIRPYLDDLFRKEEKEALNAYLEAGNEPETFEFIEDIDKERFNHLFKQAQDARSEERRRIENEKQNNLKRKREILNVLKELTEKDETQNTIEDVKKLQSEWKIIRVLPKENVQELWDAYHFYLNKFYDNHSINIELKDLDRRKNLEIKIELCKKVDELHQETSIKRCFILLNKYHEDFRNTGPVPREFSEEIWSRFKSASDNVYQERKGLMEEAENHRKENLALKEILLEKASIVAGVNYDSMKAWGAKTQEMTAIFEEWKKIGTVPHKRGEDIWKKFREYFNEFYKNKSEYFQNLNKERKANLIIKEDLCKKAEEFLKETDISYSIKEILKLQDEWKKTGPVPEKISNALWKRFRTACDAFFQKKQRGFADRKKQEEDNLKLRQEILVKIRTLKSLEDKNQVAEALNELRKEWNNSGFVPHVNINEINNSYQKAVEEIYKQFKLDRESVKGSQVKEHFQSMMTQPNGASRVKFEEGKIRDRMKFLKEEIETWENNIQFFARSANADKLRQEIKAKIDKTNGQLERLNKELNAIKSLTRETVK